MLFIESKFVTIFDSRPLNLAYSCPFPRPRRCSCIRCPHPCSCPFSCSYSMNMIMNMHMNIFFKKIFISDISDYSPYRPNPISEKTEMSKWCLIHYRNKKPLVQSYFLRYLTETPKCRISKLAVKFFNVDGDLWVKCSIESTWVYKHEGSMQQLPCNTGGQWFPSQVSATNPENHPEKIMPHYPAARNNQIRTSLFALIGRDFFSSSNQSRSSPGDWPMRGGSSNGELCAIFDGNLPRFGVEVGGKGGCLPSLIYHEYSSQALMNAINYVVLFLCLSEPGHSGQYAPTNSIT